MESEKKKGYAARITQANRSELVVIIYELMLDSIQEAQENFVSGNLEMADRELKRAQGLLTEMRGSLDFQYEISVNLAALYRYVHEQLVHSIVRQKDVNLDSCQRVLRGLMTGFVEVAKQDHSEPVMENVQQVYAGLTYGRGSLNEVAVDAGQSGRGFRV